MKRMVARVAAAAIALCAGTAAMAGDDNGNFMVRLQGTYLSTKESTKSLTALNGGVDLKANGYSAEVSNEFVPTATLTYFFSKNIAVELFCCFATADLDLKGPTSIVPNAPGNVASTWMFPPILTLQYHFTGLGAFKPYVGVGAQYIHFFSTDGGTNILNAQKVSFDDAFGPAVQAGFDMALGSGWYLNADIKKSWLSTTGTWSNTTYQDVKGKVDLDPMTVSVGLGYRFNLEDIFGSRSTTSLK